MSRASRIVSAVFFLMTSAASAQTGVFVPSPVFDGGGMRMQVHLHGQIGSSSDSRGAGLFWPGDGVSSPLSRTLCYSSTPVFIGRIQDERRVSASYYRNSFLPGPIVGGKPPGDPTDPLFRAYTITQGQTSDQDYREWPAALGAPVQADGTPLFYGRKQMFWVMNDLDTAAMAVNNGCLPPGLEMRCLLYEPWSGAARENTLLLQVTYINIGPEPISDAYAGYFMDMDIRHGFTDNAGTDSLRGMVYSYSSDNQGDEGMPAAMGLVMLQTPAVGAPGERARWYAGWKADARNIPVAAAVLPIKTGINPIQEPAIGTGSAEQWSRLMRGMGTSDVYVINPATGVPSRFWVSGDPISGTGWLPHHGIQLSNGQLIGYKTSDKRVLISSGPFDLAPGDTQQVTFAFIAARGATTAAALQDLMDRADFIRADFMQTPIAMAYREAYVHPPDSSVVPGTVRVNARFTDLPVELHVEARNRFGTLLLDTTLDRSSSGNDWVYSKAATARGSRQEGVNISFVAKWNGEIVRIPGRVSLPLDKHVELRWVHMLEEGDANHRVAPDEDAKWFPYFINNTRFMYNISAMSYYLPDSQWMYVRNLQAFSTIPSAERPWDNSMGYNTLWDPSRITSSGEMVYHYDLFESVWNVWWESDYRIPTDTAAADWYDVLMTQVRGRSSERPGVRLINLSDLVDKWYVATISGGMVGSRTLSLHDSASGVPYFDGYGLDHFTFASPQIDGFRVVRGTITVPRQSGHSVTEEDLFIFNPRHVLIARARNPVDNWAVSNPSPQPLTEWTTLTIDIPEPTLLRAEVYNAIGQRVKILRNEFLEPGRHLLIWDGYWTDGRTADSGTYLLRVVTGSGEWTRKIMVLR